MILKLLISGAFYPAALILEYSKPIIDGLYAGVFIRPMIYNRNIIYTDPLSPNISQEYSVLQGISLRYKKKGFVLWFKGGYVESYNTILKDARTKTLIHKQNNWITEIGLGFSLGDDKLLILPIQLSIDSEGTVRYIPTFGIGIGLPPKSLQIGVSAGVLFSLLNFSRFPDITYSVSFITKRIKTTVYGGSSGGAEVVYNILGIWNVGLGIHFSYAYSLSEDYYAPYIILGPSFGLLEEGGISISPLFSLRVIYQDKLMLEPLVGASIEYYTKPPKRDKKKKKKNITAKNSSNDKSKPTKTQIEIYTGLGGQELIKLEAGLKLYKSIGVIIGGFSPHIGLYHKIRIKHGINNDILIVLGVMLPYDYDNHNLYPIDSILGYLSIKINIGILSVEPINIALQPRQGLPLLIPAIALRISF